jgi:hypothetical protein
MSEQKPWDQYLHCGLMMPGNLPCPSPARYQGAFLVGAWQALVPICTEHVRNFDLMIRAGELSGGGEAAAAKTLTMKVHLAPQIHELGSGDEYKAIHLLTCDQCGAKIVRSMESGKWLEIPETRPREKLMVAEHEHVPG